MGKQIIRDQRVWLSGLEFTSSINALAVTTTAELLDKTTLGETARRRHPGLKDTVAQHEGFFEETPDDELFAAIGFNNVPMTMTANGNSEGDTAFSFLSQVGEYQPGASVGEMFGFSVGAEGNSDMVRGILIGDRSGVVASADGPGYELGQVAEGQQMFFAVHYTQVAPTGSLTLRVESDDNAGFATPTMRLIQIMDQATLTFVGRPRIGLWTNPVPGPVSDNHWRLTWEVAGPGPFTFAAFFGIQ